MSDNFITQYINEQVQNVLNSPVYASLTPEQRESKKIELTNKLHDLVLNTLIDNLSDQQVMELNSLDPNSPQMMAKIMEFSASIPNLATILEEKMNQEVETLKNPQ